MIPVSRGHIREFLSLSSVQLANSLLPLITIPYVVRVIGAEKYGIISFAAAICAYLFLVVDFGFDLTATRAVARNRADRSALASIFWSTIVAKALLAVVAFAIAALLLGISAAIQAEAAVFTWTFVAVFGNILFPIWFFQGIGKFGIYAGLNFLVRAVATALVFLIVRAGEDYVLVPMSYSAGSIIAGMMGFIFAIREVGHGGGTLDRNSIVSVLRAGWSIFVSRGVISLYTTSTTVMLGSLTTAASVGWFTGASKIVYAIQALVLVPLSQLAFPELAIRLKEGGDDGVRALARASRYFLAAALPLSAVLAIFAKPIVAILLGPGFEPSESVLLILAPLPTLLAMSNLHGIQGCLNMNQERTFLAVTAGAGMLSITLNAIMIPLGGERAAAAVWVLTEFLVVAALVSALACQGVVPLAWMLRPFRRNAS